MRRLTSAAAAATFLLASVATMGAAVAEPGGANACDPLTTTCPYSDTGASDPSGNGAGNSNNPHPAGSVGRADDKNPPGQIKKDGIDPDYGYECDANSGVGLGNPAHSGCEGTIG